MLAKDWIGKIVICTEVRMTTMVIESSKPICIPMRGPMGLVSQEQEADALRTIFEKPSDVYMVHYKTPAGVQKQGMFAVPRAIKPSVTLT